MPADYAVPAGSGFAEVLHLACQLGHANLPPPDLFFGAIDLTGLGRPGRRELEGIFSVRMPKVSSALVIALFVSATSEPTNAVDVEYTLSFAGTGGNRANGTGTLIVNEPRQSILLARTLTET